MNKKKLAIAIISYNTKQLLDDCLKSLTPELTSEIEVIVVDNASTDGSVAMLEKKYPEVRTIKNTQNKGFAQANNQAIEATQSEYVLLLNSDTIVGKGSIRTLITFMDHHPKVGIVSAQLLNNDGSIQPAGGQLPSLFTVAIWMLFVDDLPVLRTVLPRYHQDSTSAYTKTKPFGWIPGTAMTLRREMLDETGLLDGNIFMYSEDTEICLRARKSGWLVYLCAEATVTHLAHKSGSKTSAVLGEYTGLLYLFKTHYPSWQLPLVRGLLKIGAVLRMTIFGKIQGRKELYDTYLQAYKLV